jgi:hypothetical protein
MVSRSRFSSLPERTSVFIMVLALAAGYRRWLSRPWQLSLRDYLATIALCAGALSLPAMPTSLVIVLTIVAASVLITLRLAQFGFRLADVLTMLAIILLTAAFLLPAMEQMRAQTLGKRSFPPVVPARYLSLFSGPE